VRSLVRSVKNTQPRFACHGDHGCGIGLEKVRACFRPRQGHISSAESGNRSVTGGGMVCEVSVLCYAFQFTLIQTFRLPKIAPVAGRGAHPDFSRNSMFKPWPRVAVKSGGNPIIHEKAQIFTSVSLCDRIKIFQERMICPPSFSPSTN
jgi:hypothetical protein